MRNWLPWVLCPYPRLDGVETRGGPTDRRIQSGLLLLRQSPHSLLRPPSLGKHHGQARLFVTSSERVEATRLNSLCSVAAQ